MVGEQRQGWGEDVSAVCKQVISGFRGGMLRLPPDPIKNTRG